VPNTLPNGPGEVFELKANAAQDKWTFAVLYTFCAQPACTDGQVPVAPLVMDASGNLYVTTDAGGAHGQGTVFELTPILHQRSWVPKVLYSCCAQSGCADGASPVAGLAIDLKRNLYGTTSKGGAHDASLGGNDYGGTVFELTP
jgi:uncharacterized repeat protein (TIGR03803 family)